MRRQMVVIAKRRYGHQDQSAHVFLAPERTSAHPQVDLFGFRNHGGARSRIALVDGKSPSPPDPWYVFFGRPECSSIVVLEIPARPRVSGFFRCNR